VPNTKVHSCFPDDAIGHMFPNYVQFFDAWDQSAFTEKFKMWTCGDWLAGCCHPTLRDVGPDNISFSSWNIWNG